MGPNGEPVPFHMAQQLAQDSQARVVALLAGKQGGKTTYLPVWMWKQVQRLGRGDYLVATATYDLLKLQLLPAFQRFFIEALGIARYWAGDRVFELCDPETGRFWANASTDAMWGRILMRSAAAGSGGRTATSVGSLESITANAAALDEAGLDTFSVGAYRSIQARLAIKQGPMIIATTLYNLGWVKKYIIDAAKAGGESRFYYQGEAELEHTVNAAAGIELLQYDSIINPAFSVQEYDRLRNDMPEDEFMMSYRGRVAKMRSLIFDVFDEKTHVIPSFNPPPHWAAFVGIDPLGQRTAALWGAYDRENAVLHIYREYYEPYGLTTQEHVNKILALSRGEPVFRWIGGGPSENQVRLDWNAAGLPMEKSPVTDVWVGIGRIYTMLKTGHMVIHDCCENLISEFGGYRRKASLDGEMTNVIENKDDWHAIDAGRYLISWLTQPDDEEETEIIYRPNLIR